MKTTYLRKFEINEIFGLPIPIIAPMITADIANKIYEGEKIII